MVAARLVARMVVWSQIVISVSSGGSSRPLYQCRNRLKGSGIFRSSSVQLQPLFRLLLEGNRETLVHVRGGVPRGRSFLAGNDADAAVLGAVEALGGDQRPLGGGADFRDGRGFAGLAAERGAGHRSRNGHGEGDSDENRAGPGSHRLYPFVADQRLVSANQPA
jgi:hypothetical protein